ncbi:MAG: methyltransferase [Bacilli bacterium]|nr:methyltransferase [Clostridium sp.]MDY6015168.1 methyltransferase [Bacilli bacterium]
MSQYFDNVDLKSNIEKYKTRIFDKEFYFNTDNGVFSKSKLDFGTRCLLENLPLEEIKGEILEVGCGYGVIPIILTRIVDKIESFDAVDVNKRALHLAEMNKKENFAPKVNFFLSDCYKNINKKYDVIISNPPIRAGKNIVYEIVMNARNYLKEDGKLFIVINKDQGAKSLYKDLEKVYKCELINKKKGFWIIKCILR